jgi:hypothetical protein
MCVVCFRQKAFIEQHEDHEDDDNEHRHDDAGPTEGSHAGREAADSPESVESVSMSHIFRGFLV